MQTVLSDVERRVIANLSIPRNVADLAHELRRDPYFPALSDGALHEVLSGAESDGLVVNLGDGSSESPGVLAARVDDHRDALSMPDEKAKLFEQRLSLPHRAWRLAGDVYILTNAGFDQLHAADAPPALDTAALAAMIRNEWARTKIEVDPENPQVRIGDALTGDEFMRWHQSVTSEWKKANGSRKLPPALSPPIAGGAGYSDATENLIVDAENGKGAGYVVTAPWFMALTTVAVTDADTGSTITEANYTGYARKSVAASDMNAASGGAASNNTPIVFAACTGGTSTVIGFAKCVAAAAGVLQKYGTCASVTISTTQTPAQFASGAFTTSLD